MNEQLLDVIDRLLSRVEKLEEQISELTPRKEDEATQRAISDDIKRLAEKI